MEVKPPIRPVEQAENAEEQENEEASDAKNRNWYEVYMNSMRGGR